MLLWSLCRTSGTVITFQNANDLWLHVADIVKDAAAMLEHTPDMVDDGKKVE